MKDIRMKKALNRCCNFCDYCNCSRVVKGHQRKPAHDCPTFKRNLKQMNKWARKKEKEDLKKMLDNLE